MLKIKGLSKEILSSVHHDHIDTIESLDFIVNEPIELTKEELNDLMKRFDKYVKYLQSLSLQVSKWNKALKGKL